MSRSGPEMELESRVGELELVNEALASQFDEAVWYLAEAREMTAQLGMVVALLARLVGAKIAPPNGSVGVSASGLSDPVRFVERVGD